jgi:hypothetical protein
MGAIDRTGGRVLALSLATCTLRLLPESTSDIHRRNAAQNARAGGDAQDLSLVWVTSGLPQADGSLHQPVLYPPGPNLQGEALSCVRRVREYVRRTRTGVSPAPPAQEALPRLRGGAGGHVLILPLLWKAGLRRCRVCPRIRANSEKSDRKGPSCPTRARHGTAGPPILPAYGQALRLSPLTRAPLVYFSRIDRGLMVGRGRQILSIYSSRTSTWYTEFLVCRFPESTLVTTEV